MVVKIAVANVKPRRQRTQYSCVAASMAMCLHALGVDTDEDTVNRVLGAQPMRGASWEQAIACAQHYGMRVNLICPATLEDVKHATDRGNPVMIAWNPEGRPWSHASVVFDVTPAHVKVADSNIPNPSETVRVLSHDDFYRKWYEQWPDYLVRRPALIITREISTDGEVVRHMPRTANLEQSLRRLEAMTSPLDTSLTKLEETHRRYAGQCFEAKVKSLTANLTLEQWDEVATLHSRTGSLSAWVALQVKGSCTPAIPKTPTLEVLRSIRAAVDGFVNSGVNNSAFTNTGIQDTVLEFSKKAMNFNDGSRLEFES